MLKNATQMRGVASRTIPTSISNPRKRSEAASSSDIAKRDDSNQHHSHPPELSGSGSEETELGSSDGEDFTWISWFCGLGGHEFLCEVDENYINDDFNLCGLQGQVPNYDRALDMILDTDSFSGELDGGEHDEIESSAELLYGLIHSRYILTSKGLDAMHEKFKRADFGRCLRFFCGGQPCLPVGLSDIPYNGTVKTYCPKCEDVYIPRCKYQCNLDGAFFGTTLPHLFLMTFPSANPQRPYENYVPRVFGFKLHRSSR